MLFKLSLIVLALQVASIYQAACDRSPDEVYELLTSEEDLETNKALALLDELREVNYPFDSIDLQNVLELAKDKTIDCSYSYYYYLNKLETKYSVHNESIVPLLRKFRWARFNECKDEYEEKIEKAMIELSPEVERKVKEVCDVRDGGFLDLYKDQVDRLVKYMSKNETVMDLRLLKSHRQFYLTFGETMEDVCFPYLKDMYDELNVYNLMVPNEDPNGKLTVEQLAEALITNVPNGRVLLWIIHARMCVMIFDDMQLFSESVRKELKRKVIKSQGNFWTSLMSGISRKKSPKA